MQAAKLGNVVGRHAWLESGKRQSGVPWNDMPSAEPDIIIQSVFYSRCHNQNNVFAGLGLGLIYTKKWEKQKSTPARDDIQTRHLVIFFTA